MQRWVGDDAIGIGFSGFDFDDYLEILPKYLKYAPNVENIVIFMGDIYDIVPASRKNTVFQKVSTHADYISYHYHLYSFRHLYRKFRLHEWDFIGNKKIQLFNVRKSYAAIALYPKRKDGKLSTSVATSNNMKITSLS